MPSLFESTPLYPIPFAGATFDEANDRERLTTQIECIRAVVSDQGWRTVQGLTAELRKGFRSINFPENSVQAQLRNLRKVGYRVERRNVAKTGSLFEYRVLPPVNPGVGLAVREGAAR